MFENLVALGWGLVTFAIVIGIGTLVLAKFSTSLGLLDNNNDSAVDGFNATTNYLKDQLGTSGLAGWAPAVIAFSVGMLFLGAFMVNKGKSRSY